MTFTSVSTRTTRKYAVDALRAASGLPGGAEGRIGDSKPPDDITTPHTIVYNAGVTNVGGPAADPQADWDQLLQATSVGHSMDEAEGMTDAVLAVWQDPATWSSMTDRALAGPVTVEALLPTRREDILGEHESVFTSIVIVRVPLTPAT